MNVNVVNKYHARNAYVSSITHESNISLLLANYILLYAHLPLV